MLADVPAVMTPWLAVAPHVVLLALFERRIPPCSSCNVSVALWKLTSIVKPPPMRRRPVTFKPEARSRLEVAAPVILLMLPLAKMPAVTGVLSAVIFWPT